MTVFFCGHWEDLGVVAPFMDKGKRWGTNVVFAATHYVVHHSENKYQSNKDKKKRKHGQLGLPLVGLSWSVTLGFFSTKHHILKKCSVFSIFVVISLIPFSPKGSKGTRNALNTETEKGNSPASSTNASRPTGIVCVRQWFTATLTFYDDACEN